ncbi:hypothetical protein [Chromobacterium sp. IIBBL 290-4]|uniref:hypothetical protein n=1 Tax=Chromobacterium sp. IIBBL 290-4 TaxID=2953890 RepID=UPI0020B7AC7B|nr:hypothetical protein [Chromobacterium sp. IIBBL 290-4]UTH75874.1 hypothetical protein NKT35_07155 [Chromobacterium sp. IIBBL 290-4]
MYKPYHPFNFFLACSFTLLSACSGGGSGSNSQQIKSNQPGTAVNPATGTYTMEGNLDSVVGIDSEHRGYRDDVWQKIQDLHPSTPNIKAGAELIARMYQQSITTYQQNSPETTDSIVYRESENAACAIQMAGPEKLDELTKINGAIYARTYNTLERLSARQAAVNSPTSIISLNVAPTHCPQTGNAQ